jgi:hypothetical protein
VFRCSSRRTTAKKTRAKQSLLQAIKKGAQKVHLESRDRLSPIKTINLMNLKRIKGEMPAEREQKPNSAR